MALIEKILVILTVIATSSGILYGVYKWGCTMLGKKINEMICCNEYISSLKNDTESLKTSHSKVENGVLGILMLKLEEKCGFYIERHWATVDNKKSISVMHKAYKELGGNSFIDGLVHAVSELPHSQEEYLSRMHNN